MFESVSLALFRRRLSALYANVEMVSSSDDSLLSQPNGYQTLLSKIVGLSIDKAS